MSDAVSVPDEVVASKWAIKTVVDDKDIRSTRSFLQSVAKAIRWKGPVPDPAEHPCGVMVKPDSVPNVFLIFVEDRGFSISVSSGSATVNGRVIDPATDRFREILNAAELFASVISRSDVVRADPAHSLIHKFIEMWKCLDPTNEPKSAFEIHRMFVGNQQAAEILREVRLQFTPYLYKDVNRFEQMDAYLTSRPDRFQPDQTPIAGNKVWSIK